MNQVHKETLSHVENALANRQGLDVEIFGMEGVPEDVKKQHEERIVKNYFDAQRERFEATGNPPPGEGRPTKKIRIESPEELKKRFAEFRANKAAGKTQGSNGAPAAAPGAVQSPAQSGSPGTFVSTATTSVPSAVTLTGAPELSFQPPSTLRPAWLSQLPSECRPSCCSLQPILIILSPRPTALSPQRTWEPAPAPRLPCQLLPWPGPAWLSRCRCVNNRRAGGRRCQVRRRHRSAHPHGRGRHQARKDGGRSWSHGGTACGERREEVQEGKGPHDLFGRRIQPRGEDGHVTKIPMATCVGCDFRSGTHAPGCRGFSSGGFRIKACCNEALGACIMRRHMPGRGVVVAIQVYC